MTTFSYSAFDQLKKPGDVSTVIETDYGYHVIYLNQRIPPVHVTVDEASASLRANIFPNWRKGAFLSYVEALKKERAVAVHFERVK